jgi:ABC-type amino acid transport substrate-binding protein
MRRRDFVTAITLSVLAGGPALAEEARRLVMASLVSNNESFAARWLALIYTDAFQQLGVELDIRNFPAARAAAEAAAGNVDGELARSYEYEATQTALVRVPEPTFFARTIAFARRPDIQLAPGWESLRGTPYHVEYRLGYPVIAQKLADVLPASQLSEVRNAETGLRKLVLGRSDLYVDFADIVEAMLERTEFRAAGIRAVAILERGPVHAYLNRKHADLVPRLAAVLKKMRDSGQVERYRQQALHQK